MFKKILYTLSFVSRRKFDETVQNYGEVIRRMANEKLKLQAEVAALKVVDSGAEKKYIDINTGDPAPSKVEDRKMYVAKVAGFHKEVLEPKITHMLSVTHNLLEEMGNDRDFDLVMKGVVYCLRDFLKWGTSMINEQIANQTEVEEAKKGLQDRLNENK